MSSESRGKGVLFCFTSILLFFVWGQWKHSNEDRVKKAKKASAEYRESQKTAKPNMETMGLQAGYGSFLVEQDLANKGPRRKRNRGGRHKKNNRTMNADQGAADQADNFKPLLTNGATSFPPAENESNAPRTATTIDAEKLLSPSEDFALDSPPLLHLHHQPQTSHYSQDYTTANKPPSMATTVTTTKAVPPHLRPKKTNPPPARPSNKQNDSTFDIRGKLAEHSVIVSDPKPAAKVAKSASTRAPKSEASDQLVYRGRGCRPWGGERNPNWPTKEDFLKVDPKRWDTNWDDSPQAKSSSIDSARADSGWGTSKKKRNVDEAGYKLADPWSGQWAPAPVDWDSRPAFRTDQNENQIQQWLDCHERQLEREGIVSDDQRTLFTGSTTISGTKYSFIPSDEGLRSGAEQHMGDMCPAYWIPPNLGRMPLQQYWHEILQSSPKPADDDDLRSAKPYWEMLPRGAQFFPPIEHPACADVDPDESPNERLKRENDLGSGQHSENRKAFERAKAAAKNERQRLKTQKKQHIAAKIAKSNGSLKQEPLFKPGSKMFLRSAKPTDIHAIRDIYNHYVNATCAVPETTPQTDREMLHKYQDIVASRLPFIVAVQRGDLIKGRKKKNFGEDIALPDKVIGFAVADNYIDLKSMCRCTAYLSIFVHVDYRLKGVGSCLMDKMLALLDPDHIERGGYEIEGEELEALGPPARLIKSILINFSHEQTTQGANRLVWMDRWLTTLGFQQHGLLPEIGTKLDHAVDLAIFHRPTGATLDHTKPPAVINSSRG